MDRLLEPVPVFPVPVFTVPVFTVPVFTVPYSAAKAGDRQADAEKNADLWPWPCAWALAMVARSHFVSHLTFKSWISWELGLVISHAIRDDNASASYALCRDFKWAGGDFEDGRNAAKTVPSRL